MTEYQKKLVEMLKWLSEFIESKGLRYYVVEGTMLGAVRHNGIIPWDDDVDIAMPRPDYERLIQLLKEPVDHYVVESCDGEAKDYPYALAKFYDTNTSMTEYLRRNVNRGVYIDIFPLDGVGNSKEEGYKHYKRVDRANMLLAMKVCAYRKDRAWWKNFAVFIGGLIPLSVKKQTRRSVLNFPDLGSPEPICSPIGVIAISAPRLKSAIPSTSAIEQHAKTTASTNVSFRSGVALRRSTISATGSTDIADSFNLAKNALNIEKLH